VGGDRLELPTSWVSSGHLNKAPSLTYQLT